MKRHAWKEFALAGLLGLTGLAVGCTEREEAGVREEAREAGEEVEEAGEEAGEELERTGREAEEDLREGTGGAGTEDDADIGEREGVINDGEGPLEENTER